MTSPKNSFKGTGKKMIMSLGLSLLGAFATWLVTINQNFDFGTLAPFVGALAPVIANAIKEFVNERQ